MWIFVSIEIATIYGEKKTEKFFFFANGPYSAASYVQATRNSNRNSANMFLIEKRNDDKYKRRQMPLPIDHKTAEDRRMHIANKNVGIHIFAEFVWHRARALIDNNDTERQPRDITTSRSNKTQSI